MTASTTPCCSRCAEPGHNARTCPWPEEPCGHRIEIAQLRLEADALALEVAQYEDVVARCTVRIEQNRARIVTAQVRIARLRGGGV